MEDALVSRMDSASSTKCTEVRGHHKESAREVQLFVERVLPRAVLRA